MTKIKNIINLINLVASAFFGGLGLYLVYNNQSMGLAYILLSAFLLVTVLLYNFSLSLKGKAHKGSALVQYIKSQIASEDAKELLLNKIMTVMFLIDAKSYKHSGKTLTGTTWAWQNKNPVNPLVVAVLEKLENSNKLNSNYEISIEEKQLMNSVLSKVQNLSKIEVDVVLFETYPSLQKFESRQAIISMKNVV